MDTERVIELSGVRVVYPNPDGDRVALDGVEISFGRETVALLGPNGAGKSTMMGLVAGTHRTTEGEVRIDRSMNVGMVFQTVALDELLTVRENLELAGGLYGMSRGTIGSGIERLIELLGIGDRIDQRVGQLSGGLQRRVDLARALLPSPGVLLLDEPTTGLDVEARASLWSTIDAIREERSMCVLVATHMTEEARRADRVVMIREGKVVVDGSPTALVEGMGRWTVRVVLGEEGDFDRDRQVIDRWCEDEGCSLVWSGREALIRDAKKSMGGSCPVEGARVSVASASLEDVYLWNARVGMSGAGDVGVGS